MNLFLTAAVLLTVAATQLPGAADPLPATSSITLSGMFSDNMVLQRDRAIPVWGWAAPGTEITVSIKDKTAKAKAGADGKWLAKLPRLGAGGPYTMTVSGPNTINLENVLIGDVWICSGQSNMEFGIGNGINAKEEIANANYPQIRLFTVEKRVAIEPLDKLTGKWEACTPETVSHGGWGGFSAVGYFFGRELYKQLNVPIGLVHTSWGGTPAEAWTSADGLNTMADYRPTIAKIAEARTEIDKPQVDIATQMEQWWTKNDPGSSDGLGWADPKLDTSGWKTMVLPTVWEKAGLPDFDGVVWFQKQIDLPENAYGKDLVLHLGPIDDRDTTWVNGVKVGASDVYDIVRDYRVAPGIMKPGRNIITVRVLDTGGFGGLYGKPEQMSLEIPGQDLISLATEWRYKASVALDKMQPVPGVIKEDQNFPTTLYNGMIAPVLPYGIKGAIWYQGESNSGKSYQYRTLLPTMIKDWRGHWGQGDFPFYIVQLANFMAVRPQPSEDGWAELREAQLMTAQSTPKTGLAVTVDIGDAADVHPKNKQEVGKRLALAALATTYGKKIEYSGPAYKSMRQNGNAIRLSFDHVGGGLLAKGGGKLEGFAIAGENRHFVWADAVIDGDTIVVSSPKIAKPVAVRYAWASNPICNLYNQADLPASPFRTDQWPGVTYKNK